MCIKRYLDPFKIIQRRSVIFSTSPKIVPIVFTQELMTELSLRRVTKEHYFISKLIKVVNTEACISDCRVSVCYKTRPEKRPCLIPAPCRRLFIMSNFSVCGLYSQKEGWQFITPRVCLPRLTCQTDC